MNDFDCKMQYFANQRKEKQKVLEQEIIAKEVLNPKEIEKALYIIDMNNGFVNFGVMANQAYNSLLPEQLRMIEKIRKEKGLINFILDGHKTDSVEFKSYPKHCVIDTPEAKLVPELLPEQTKVNTNTYYKNSINGMLNGNVREDIRKLKALKEVIFEGVCADLCVMDFARTYARYLDEINKEVKLFAVKNAIDTYDAPLHNREEWLDIAYKVMAQAGIEVVENFEELEEREQTLGLRR